MKNIIIQVIEFCKTNNLEYQLEGTGVGYETQLFIWDENENELSLYFDEENVDQYPNVLYWTEFGITDETTEYQVIENIIKNKFFSIKN